MYCRSIKYILFTTLALILSIANAQEPASSGISGSLTVSGCIIDNDKNFDQLASSLSVNHSAVRDITAPSGTGNFILSEATVIFDPIASPSSKNAYYLSNVSPLVNTGVPSMPSYVPEKDINGNLRKYDGRTDIGAVEYSMIFDKTNGSWNLSENWNIDRVPDENDIITVLKTVTIDNNDAIGKSIIEIGNGGKLIIEPSSQLNIYNTINNLDADKLIIKAAANKSNGTLIFHNPFTSPVYATVEMHSIANIQITGTDTAYRWQYFGVPFRSLVYNSNFAGSWVRKWNESSIKYDKWENLINTSILHSFSGYQITQSTEKQLSFKGILENRDTTILLGKSDVPFYEGQHVLSNPYTAAINISDLTFGANTEATVYVYNTGSYDDWNVDKSNGRIGENRGQYTAVPKNVAYLIYPAIPSMQGFIVRATSDAGSLTIPYASNTQNTIKQKAKENHPNSYLTIELNSQHHSDHVLLLHEATASKGFDNGWDGYKITSNKDDAVLYAKEPAGNLQINSVNDFHNMNLNFKAGKDIDYRLTIVNHRMNDVYAEMYLIDLKENNVVSIEGDTINYAFTANNIQASENRFRIMTNKEFTTAQNDLISMYHHPKEQNINIYNATEQTGSYILYDITGRMLDHEILTSGSNPVAYGQLSGVIILKAIVGSQSKTWKVIVNK